MSGVDPKHPWAVNICGTWCMTLNAQDRHQQVKNSTDVAWLEKVKNPRFTNHLTVRSAARRRLRVLAKKGGAK